MGAARGSFSPRRFYKVYLKESRVVSDIKTFANPMTAGIL
jgi:hypothetical protein